MTSYKYGTILRTLNEDPRNDIDEGTIIIEAGKLEDGDSYTALSEDGIIRVEMETVAVYEADDSMSEREAKEFARDRYLKETEAEA